MPTKGCHEINPQLNAQPDVKNERSELGEKFAEVRKKESAEKERRVEKQENKDAENGVDCVQPLPINPGVCCSILPEISDEKAAAETTQRRVRCKTL